MGRRTPTGNWNGKCCWHVFAAQSPPISEGRQFFLSPGQGGDDLGIPAGLNWAGRASVTTFVDAYGLVKEIPADCLSAPGYRLEYTLTTGVVTETVTVVSGNDYQVVIAGDSGAECVCSGAISATLTADGINRISFASGTPETAGTTSLVLTVTGTLTELSVYDVTGRSNKNPPEYVSVGVESAPIYHNARVDGYKYFSTTNANTVNPDGSINEAVGAALPGPLRLRLEEALTNKLLWTRDLTQTSVWVRNISGGEFSRALDAIGIDGKPNSATRLTVTDSVVTWAVAEQTISITSNEIVAASGYIKQVPNRTSTFTLRFEASNLRRITVVIDHDTLEITEDQNTNGTGKATAKARNGWIRFAVSLQDTWGSSTVGVLPFCQNVADTGELLQEDTIYDGINLVEGVEAGQAINESVIFDGAVNDPRAGDSPLEWSLTTPQAEGMVIWEGERALVSNASTSYVACRDVSTSNWIYLRTNGQLAMFDGTTTCTHNMDFAGTEEVVYGRWGESKFSVGFKRPVGGSSGSDFPYDGAFITGNQVRIGAANRAPMFIKSVSVYDVDQGKDWIEANFPS